MARAGLYQAEAEIQKILEEGDPAETIKMAHADIQRATEANPNDDSAWYSLALISTSDGDDQKALQCLTRAIELNPGDDRYFEARADIQLRRQNFLAAIDDYTKALEQNPDRPDLYQARGYAYGEIGRSEDAASDFDKADRLTPPATESSSETDDEQNPETPDPGPPE
ncbi:MAG: tetratricopeptide repeat protein [Planctomycetaceae bacterium]